MRITQTSRRTCDRCFFKEAHQYQVRCATMGATETEGAMSPQVISEVAKALRLTRRYRGSRFAYDELEYAAILLEEKLQAQPRPDQGYGRY